MSKILKRFNYWLILSAFVIMCLILICNPARHASHYVYVPMNNILSELVQISNIRITKLKSCSYEDIILFSHDINFKYSFKYEYQLPSKGGEFIPKDCTPLYKVAILIPYRNREEQLRIFINYVHYFLQNQNIHYKIYVVDQRDNAPFNRAKMFNIGAYEAMKSNFPCLILHDVDLIPLTSGNIYACAKSPRHMSSSLDTFRFNLPYEGLFGGVIAIQSIQFKLINGMSNLFEGWGGEDDDLYRRLEAYNLRPYRFPPEFSKYTMMKHKKAEPSPNRYILLEKTLERQEIDGLNQIQHLQLNLTVHKNLLYTHIIVN